MIPQLPAGPPSREVIAERLQPLIDKFANAPIDPMFARVQASTAALKDLASGRELRGAPDELRTANVMRPSGIGSAFSSVSR